MSGNEHHPRPYGFVLGVPGGLPPKPTWDGALSKILLVVSLLLALTAIGSLFIYGLRSYVGESKPSEAKNMLGAISRGVVSAYEHERPGPKGQPPSAWHELCGAATPVPAVAPRGVKYMPDQSEGHDYNTGDENHGWKCLRMQVSSPSYYKYEYRVGGDYKGPARGGPDPGPDGFEISAEGDLDGDGVTSLFTATGKVDKIHQTIHVDNQLFVTDELE